MCEGIAKMSTSKGCWKSKAKYKHAGHYSLVRKVKMTSLMYNMISQSQATLAHSTRKTMKFFCSTHSDQTFHVIKWKPQSTALQITFIREASYHQMPLPQW
jgi:hypothetical protein